ncbi:hypothetical protein [Nitrospina watsonii]|uniref:Uncharacterized protein n=1 Tax=Nitrospina watsonii TaxID=1323948 RepID=A0ABM9HB10_9BACT|nr:hypothetical protein [Nitrospina watsonii]CAI2717325.1 conserved protein of unknown function [Nitrospina watsonii]
MKLNKAAVATILFLGIFGGLTFSMIWSGSKYECEICISYNGYDVCQLVEGMDYETTVQTGISTACAGAANGRTESIECGMTPPTKVTCKEL